MNLPKSTTNAIADDLRQQIAAGTLKPGDPIPSATRLKEAYRCSITPVRRAVDILKAEGLIEGVPGIGVYVKAPAE